MLMRFIYINQSSVHIGESNTEINSRHIQWSHPDKAPLGNRNVGLNRGVDSYEGYNKIRNRIVALALQEG